MKKLFLILFTAVAFLGLSSCSKLGSDGLANTSWLCDYKENPEYRQEFYDNMGVYPTASLNFKEKTVSWISLGALLYETEYEYKHPTVILQIPQVMGILLGTDEKTMTGTVKGNELILSFGDEHLTFHKK